MKKIFLLEDNDDVAHLIVNLCTHFKSDAKIVRTSTVQEGVDILSTNQEFALAILDYELPDGYGTELVETIRRRVPQCKIVVASGNIPHDQDAVRLITRQKPDKMLGKPLNMNEFAQTLREFGIIE